MTKYTYFLPYPPTANSLYPGKQTRHKSKQYKAWIKEAHIAMMKQRKPVKPIDYAVTHTISLVRPDERVRDAVNLEKAVADFMVSCGVLKDDEYIIDNRQKWTFDTHDRYPCMVEIETSDKWQLLRKKLRDERNDVS